MNDETLETNCHPAGHSDSSGDFACDCCCGRSSPAAAAEVGRCAKMRIRLLGFLSAMIGAGLILTSGCACRDGATAPRKVALRIEPRGADVRLRAEWDGEQHKVALDERGIYRFDIPSMRRAENVWLGFIKIRTYSGDTKPFLYVVGSDGSVSHFSARQIARFPVDADGVSVLNVKKRKS